MAEQDANINPFVFVGCTANSLRITVCPELKFRNPKRQANVFVVIKVSPIVTKSVVVNSST